MYTVSPSGVEHEFRQLQEFVGNLYPTPTALTYKVTPDLQQRELGILREGLRTEQFFFIVDFVNLQIIEAVGLEEIGYNSKQFTFRQYLSTIPSGGILQLVTMLGKQAFRFSEQSNVVFMNPKFVAYIPMTTADGRVLLVKRTISPWQFTSTGQLTAYLSEFMILKSYDNEPMYPRFINLDPSVEAEYNSQLTRLFSHLPVKENLFSHKEMALLKLYVNPLHDATPARDIARLAKIQLNTLNTHNKNILSKAKIMFSDTLPAKTAREVAVFLKKCGLLADPY